MGLIHCNNMNESGKKNITVVTMFLNSSAKNTPSDYVW